MNDVKGVSPVVAEVLLVGIAVSGAVSAGVFLQGTLGDVQEGAENRLQQEDRIESTSIDADFGYNGTNGYFIVDIRNTGSYTLSVVDGGNKNWNMYLEGVPNSWSFMQGSSYVGENEVLLNPQSTITINTTSKFPSTGNSKEVEFSGPYEISTSYLCYSENGGCAN